MSLAQGSYCKQKDLDPEDPRCAHLILSGRFMPVNEYLKSRIIIVLHFFEYKNRNRNLPLYDNSIIPFLD